MAGVSSGVALVAGAFAGYFFANHWLKEYYAELSSREIAEARDYYRVLYKANAPDINAVAEELIPEVEREAIQAHRSYSGIKPATEDPRVEILGGTNPPMDLIVQNIFRDTTEYKDEEMRRTEEAPYIIAKEEYFEEEDQGGLGHECVTLTYYEGDGVLTEEDETVVEDVDDTVGLDCLTLFGHRSGDKNILYVRNHYLEKDFQILKRQTKYSEEVAGLGGS